jgi:hypothetical protein
MEVVVINVILDIFLILNNNALIVSIIAKYVVMLPPVSSVMMVIIWTVVMDAQNVIFIAEHVPKLHQIVPHAMINFNI